MYYNDLKSGKIYVWGKTINDYSIIITESDINDILKKVAYHNPQNEYVLKELERIAEMWLYKKYLGCSYSEENEKLIKDFLIE